jgi:hypothetical protein
VSVQIISHLYTPIILPNSLVFAYSFNHWCSFTFTSQGFEDRFQGEANVSASAIRPTLVKVTFLLVPQSTCLTQPDHDLLSTCTRTAPGIHAWGPSKALCMVGWCDIGKGRFPSKPACHQGRVRRDRPIHCAQEVLLETSALNLHWLVSRFSVTDAAPCMTMVQSWPCCSCWFWEPYLLLPAVSTQKL